MKAATGREQEQTCTKGRVRNPGSSSMPSRIRQPVPSPPTGRRSAAICDIEDQVVDLVLSLLHPRQPLDDFRPDPQALVRCDSGVDINVEHIAPLQLEFHHLLEGVGGEDADDLHRRGYRPVLGNYRMPLGYCHAARRISAPSRSAAGTEERNFNSAT